MNPACFHACTHHLPNAQHLPTACAHIPSPRKVGIRFSSCRPLVPPEGREDAVYSLVDGEWHEEDDVPTVTQQAIAAAFPFAMAKQYR